MGVNKDRWGENFCRGR